MAALGGDWPLTMAVIAASLGLVVAVAFLARIAYRLRIAFGERLHHLPGARWYRRIGHNFRFWFGVLAQLAIAVVMLVYIVAALRFLARVFLR